MNSAQSDAMFASTLLDPERLDALLAHLATDVQKGVATLEGLAIPGKIGVCLQTCLPTFTPDPGVAGPNVQASLGRSLRLSYHHQGDRSWFDSRVLTAGPNGDWQLLRPSAVTTSTRRLVPRICCTQNEGLELRIEGSMCSEREGSLPLGDLSTDGLGILYYPNRTPIRKGQRIEGWLQVPGQIALHVALGVVTVSVTRPGSHQRRASTRFVSMRLEDRLQLASGLAALTMQSWTGGSAMAK